MESRRPGRQKAEKHRFPTGWGGFRIFHRQPPAARAAANPAGAGKFPAAEGTGALLCGGFPPLLHSDRAAKPPAGVRRNGVFFPVFPAVGAAGGAGSGFSTVSAGSTASTKKDLILSVLFVSCARTRKQEKETGHGPSPCPAGQGTGMSHLTFLKPAWPVASLTAGRKTGMSYLTFFEAGLGRWPA